ncbi:MAG: hypothetical protein HOP16_16150 [Acidobacteria bacterium]|nr:hypothetical protein [Acidobacteriota bacterium]
MQDVVIQRCTVTVVRRSGWSWGADRRALIRSVTDAVPALVAERLAVLFGDTAEPATFTEPIRVRMTMRLDDLAGRTAITSGPSAVAPAWRAQLDRALDDAIHAAVGSPGVGAMAPGDAVAATAPVVLAPPRPGPFTEELMRAIESWRSAGVLTTVIARLDDPHVRAWIEALASVSGSVDATGGDAAAPSRKADVSTLSVTPARVVHSIGTGEPSRRAKVDRAQDEPGYSDPRVDPSDRTEPLPMATRHSASVQFGQAASETAAFPSAASSEPVPVVPVRGDSGTSAATRDSSIVDGEARVPSALPWLILGPLRKIGYLSTLRAALEAASLSVDAPLFGAALALKLSPAADRQWSKSAASERLASAAAARDVPISKVELHRFAGRVAPYSALVDATIASAVLAGHEAKDPWIVHRVPGSDDAGSGAGFGVVDATGLFSIAWGCGATDVALLVRERSDAGCIVLEDAADAELMRALEQADVRFFTTARAGRGESWRTVPGASAPTWRTNRPSPVDADMRGWLRRAPGFEERLHAIAAEFGVRRVALPRDPGSNLECSLTLAVSVALATLAFALWHAHEATDALLMLQRFHDLDAHVRFTRRAVRVTVPLGRRHRDLLDAGLLADVHDVPWLDGRVLEFAGG